MVPRLKSYSMPPFHKRNGWISAGFMACYFGAQFGVQYFVPGATWLLVVVLAILMIPMCIVGHRASKRWKQLLAESDGYLCPWCGYNLRETKDAEVCPECGKDPRTWRGW